MSTVAFLSHPPAPPLKTHHTPHCSITPNTHSSSHPRRTILKLISLLPFLPHATSARATKPLSVSLPPLITLQGTLETLSEEIESGTNADIRRTVKTLLIGSDIPGNVAEAVKMLPVKERERVLGEGREAYEYLNQVVEYYDPVDVKGRARGEVMKFCLEAVGEAGRRLDAVVAAFGEEGEAVRRGMLLEQ